MKNNCCHESETLAMASVPTQKWCEPYDFEKALEDGTIFPCLNLPFFQSETEFSKPQKENSMLNPAAGKQHDLLLEISQISFALDDLTLYLDTHPQCENGKNLFSELSKKRTALKEEYAKNYSPLTRDCISQTENQTHCFSWIDGPLPWEGGWISCGTTKKDCNTL